MSDKRAKNLAAVILATCNVVRRRNDVNLDKLQKRLDEINSSLEALQRRTCHGAINQHR